MTGFPPTETLGPEVDAEAVISQPLTDEEIWGEPVEQAGGGCDCEAVAAEPDLEQPRKGVVHQLSAVLHGTGTVKRSS